MGLFKKVKDREAQRAAAANAAYTQAEIAQLQNYINEQQKVIDSLLDSGKNNEAIPHINDAAAAEKEIEAKQRELLTYQRAVTAIRPAQKANKVGANNRILRNYFSEQAKDAEGPASEEYADFVQELDAYTGEKNTTYTVNATMSASKNQLTVEGNAYLAKILARREQRNAEAGGLEAQLEAAKAKE